MGPRVGRTHLGRGQIGRQSEHRRRHRTSRLRQDHGALDGVLQFAHVARPAVGQHGGACRVGKAGDFHPVFAREAAQKMIRQDRDVIRAFAQRGHMHRKHVEAVIEILAKLALAHVRQQIAVRRRDDADIDLDGAAATDALELALLEHAQELRLQRQRNFAHLVEQERAVVRQLEAALAALRRTGERPALMAEKLALDQVLRNGRAVHLDERLAAPRAAAVEFARDHFLARAALARDEHRRIGGRHPVDQLPQAGHRGTAADQQGIIVLRVVAQQPAHAQQLPVSLRLAQNHVDLARRKRLQHIVERPRQHAGDGRLDRAEPRDHHHERALRQCRDLFEKLEAVAVRQAQVEHHQVERLAREMGRRLREASGAAHRQFVPRKNRREQIPDDHVVFDDEDFLK